MSDAALKQIVQKLLKYIVTEKYRCTYCNRVFNVIPKSKTRECNHSPDGRHRLIVVHK
ncbi:MAG: hypothetical protein MR368_00205 [Azospirillum sp.]|nr:hypothetical protein [Azospirillum sp.]